MKRCAVQRGFAYVEVLLSAVLLAVLLVPALQALQSGVRGAVPSAMAAKPSGLRAKMEEVLSRPFPGLYAETYKSACDPACNSACNSATAVNCTLSDAAGATDRRVAVVYRYDASAKALSTVDTGLLYVRVYYEAEGAANALGTLAGRWW